MIEVLYGPTPNGRKITIMLEECSTPYKLRPIYLAKGDQFEPEFLELSPNNKIPAIIDHAPVHGGAPLVIFESGAILIYLAEKAGRFGSPTIYVDDSDMYFGNDRLILVKDAVKRCQQARVANKVD